MHAAFTRCDIFVTQSDRRSLRARHARVTIAARHRDNFTRFATGWRVRTRLIQALSLPPIYAYNLGLAGTGVVVEDGCDPSEWGAYYTSAQELVRFLQTEGVDGLVNAFEAAAVAEPASSNPDVSLTTPALAKLPPQMVAFLSANRVMVQKHMARFLSKASISLSRAPTFRPESGGVHD